MKKYWVFGFDQYYPSGGMGDFIDSFEVESDAEKCKNDNKNKYDYVEVVDIMRFL